VAGNPLSTDNYVAGNGTGSVKGILCFDPKWENNRASLLLLNGIVYLAFGAHGDNGPWHGWILTYNAATLARTGIWCATPNAAAGGIWMGGAGLAADVPSGKPYGRMFTSTGNGTFDAVAPTYTNAMDYGDSILKLDLNNGVPTMNNGTVVGDNFTPHDQANLNNGDQDQAAGGVLVLPDAVGGGGGAHQLVQLGKSGRIYVLNRENLGGYSPNNTKDPGESANVGGLWGAPAYFNGNVYVWATGDHLKAFSFANGALSPNPKSTSTESAGTYSPTPSVSANGATNGIVWSLKTDNYGSQGREILYAHDASNVATLLYSSESNVARDNPGNSVKFIVPRGGVNLHSGNTFKVHLNYDGTTLIMTITDTLNTSQTFTTWWPINIPSTVGASTAFVGFTGGTGGATAIQEIITWSYNNSSSIKTPVVYQTAKLTAVSSGPTFSQLPYPGFPDTTGTIIDATKVGDNVTFTVNVATAGTYDIKLSYKKYNTRGISQLAINGTNVGATLDQYAATDSYATNDYGTFAFPTAGNYSFKFTVTGKNTSSSGYSVSFDDLTLTRNNRQPNASNRRLHSVGLTSVGPPFEAGVLGVL
jgi:hypothetical protein